MKIEVYEGSSAPIILTTKFRAQERMTYEEAESLRDALTKVLDLAEEKGAYKKEVKKPKIVKSED